MKAIDKLRATWCKQEDTVLLHYPLGSQTKCDGGFLSSYITEEFAQLLSDRGYNKRTIKFSVEPKKGNVRFASQREL